MLKGISKIKVLLIISGVFNLIFLGIFLIYLKSAILDVLVISKSLPRFCSFIEKLEQADQDFLNQCNQAIQAFVISPEVISQKEADFTIFIMNSLSFLLDYSGFIKIIAIALLLLFVVRKFFPNAPLVRIFSRKRK